MSHHVIVAWTKETATAFEKSIPLRWLGERNLNLGSKNKINLLFLSGLDRLGFDYRDELKHLGYTLIDCSKIYDDYSKQYCGLDRFGDYEKKCFLRWHVIADIFGHEPVIHYDGDLVFNEIPENIESQLAQFTLVLQGCPAFVSTGKSDWLDEYKKNFREFIKDIDAYSTNAWEERQGWELSSRTKWSGSRFREIISSDQDLISHLIHVDRLPQDKPRDVKSKTDLVLFDNPLYFYVYCGELVPAQYNRGTGGVDYLNGRKIAFWHMQIDFCRYLRSIIRRGFLNKLSRCKNHLEQWSFEHSLWQVHDMILRRGMDRLQLYRHFFETTDFSCVFNDKTFWKPGVFGQ